MHRLGSATAARRRISKMFTYVVLFDIDGTLISSSEPGNGEKRRYLTTIRDVVGREPTVIPSRFAGMVDPQICKILLTETGLDDERAEYFLPKVLTRMGEIYRAMEKRPTLNEGVEELLRSLRRSQNHIVGVLTGNLSAVAKEKLKVTGIDSYFADSFYADGYFDRNRLMEDAVRTCVAKYRLPDHKNVIIVGDTPRDISAANAAKATSIGIASGTFSLEQLSQANARWVFSDLKPSTKLRNALGMRPEPP
jgi:phosphoglycolate phosphatase